METKALKKQLGAAIAMVIVAAVALGSATYAWFVSNNTVKAESATISAKSNSAYLVIDSTNTTISSKTSYSYNTNTNSNTELYPATIEKPSAGNDSGKAIWYSAYASDPSKSDIKENSKFIIHDTTANSQNADGSKESAVAMSYALKQTFYIGTGTYDGAFSNLKITGMTVGTAANDTNKNLGNAMRVLVVCGDNWQVWKAGTDASQANLLFSGTAAGDAIASSVSKSNDVTVDVYVYYDGSDTNVYSGNLTSIASTNVNNVELTFEATPTEYGKTAA